MDQSYDEMIRASEDFKKHKADKFKEVSKERLLKISKKKVQTTMIGALSTLEEKFGFTRSLVQKFWIEAITKLVI